MDDYAATAEDFDLIFTFLYNDYFLRAVFRLVYLVSYKIYIFTNNLELLGF